MTIKLKIILRSLQSVVSPTDRINSTYSTAPLTFPKFSSKVEGANKNWGKKIESRVESGLHSTAPLKTTLNSSLDTNKVAPHSHNFTIGAPSRIASSLISAATPTPMSNKANKKILDIALKFEGKYCMLIM
jgi:hypothetical protein